MGSPVESFVIALARASKRGSYHLRGLHGADKDDVIATALMWCWERRAKYDPQYTVEEWFDMMLRDARQKWLRWARFQKRDEGLTTASEFNEQMAEHLPDPTAEAAEAQSAARELMAMLEPDEREQISGIVRGSREPTPVLARKLQKLRKLLPEVADRRKVLRSLRVESDAVVDAPAPQIDKELAQIGAMPRHPHADCPVCWRCKWFDALLPGAYSQVRTVVDQEIQEAIWATETRKLFIAQGLRDGTLRFTGAAAR
jgi:hypothetical protein